ncbi:50S ribosomal protein L9 [endosymbiont GvMRE of Glomus versiforme]|uniref:50S ribosomal protein L9 n=1 Tax=endosymbiont GvMRE of Glomus versiforme TaxID=2039283 RepID=UPI000EE0E748|nr:50S ribosomal protein L9 [endosymbiont GvMRE of Glomus versiforme]RHZ37513.1 50S ribosomal protein L9 [endosymbiont GvMRE of Glomus versiforme]
MSKQLEVILAEDIKNLGKKWEVKKVKVGFYRNHPYLKEKIWLYNSQNRQIMEKRKQQEHAAALLREEKAQELYEKINNSTFSFTLKKDKNDKVFGSIRVEDILKEMKNQGFHLEKNQLLDFAPLTNLGENLLKIKLSEKLIAQVKIIIIASE